jgi:hypothetical protein
VEGTVWLTGTTCLNEITRHLLSECNYTEATWNQVAASFNLRSYAHMTLADNIEGWVREITRLGSRKEKISN